MKKVLVSLVAGMAALSFANSALAAPTMEKAGSATAPTTTAPTTTEQGTQDTTKIPEEEVQASESTSK